MSSPTTLRHQLLMWVSVPILTLWLVSAYMDYDIAKRYVNIAYDRSLLESALDIGRQVKVIKGRIYVDLPEVAVRMLRSREGGQLYYLVTGPEKEYVTGEPDLNLAQTSATGQANYYDDLYHGQTIRVAVIQFPVETEEVRGPVTVQVAETLTARAGLTREILFRIVWPQAFFTMLAVAVLWFAVRRGLAPLADLRREIEQRSHRDLSALPAHRAPQELRPLLDAMNGLLQRLSDALQAQQRFIADAAHQLRTPIAGLRTQTELALRQTSPAEMHASLAQLQTATERTTHLVNQLLSLARAEPSGERAHPLEKLDLYNLARATTTDWVPQALARNIDLGFESAETNAPVGGDAFLLREMLGNLLDNAIRYTQKNGRVTVRVTPQADKVVLSVEDNGPGIPEPEREAVLDRFYRVLGTGVEGCGLGLAIVREIALRHAGEIHLLPGTHGHGTLAQVTLPRAA